MWANSFSAEALLKKVSFNGRFLAAPQTGVQRVGNELIKSLMEVYNERVDLHSKISFQVICPRNRKHDVQAKDLPHVQFGRRTGQVWEQFELPRSDYGDLLLSLIHI